MSEAEKCVMCGAEIPDGLQVCPSCQKNVIDDISNEETIYVSHIYRGDVFFANLNPVVGNEIGGVRPVVVLQNNYGNKNSTTIIAAVTSRIRWKLLPTHVRLHEDNGGLTEGTTILLEQIRTLDKRRLRRFVGHLSKEVMESVDKAIELSLGVGKKQNEEGDNKDELQE